MLLFVLFCQHILVVCSRAHQSELFTTLQEMVLLTFFLWAELYGSKNQSLTADLEPYCLYLYELLTFTGAPRTTSPNQSLLYHIELSSVFLLLFYPYFSSQRSSVIKINRGENPTFHLQLVTDPLSYHPSASLPILPGSNHLAFLIWIMPEAFGLELCQ